MTKAHELTELGQSVWLDFIRRSFVLEGGMAEAIQQGVRGVTSNPTIFDKAISGSDDYDEDINRLVGEGKSVNEIYEALAVKDIQLAADLFRSIYDETNGHDGYVSLEVNPTLAHDTEGTIAEARRLFKTVDRANVMIKVPATPAGIPAIQTLIGDGININVTLMFSLKHYEDVANAYIRGLETLAANGGDVSKVASVASFFVSRVESAVDKALEAAGNTDILGKIAVANTRLAYARFKEMFGDARWQKLADQGAQVQRPLWASTSTKNPEYPDTMYVDELIGPHTVNTLPPATLDAFLDHGTPKLTVEHDLGGAQACVNHLAGLNIDLSNITEQLQDAGVESFAQSFESLMAGIEAKRAKLSANWVKLDANVGDYQSTIDRAIEELRANNVIQRIWDGDHTVWSDSPDEITNRLGWLCSAEKMQTNLDKITGLVSAVQQDGYTNVLLLGMGGSSLAPEVFRKTFGANALDLAVLDSTDPGAVLAYDEQLDLSKTLFVVATKSGGTAETLSFFKYFYNRTVETQGKDNAGAHFVAITDPGSKLEKMAADYQFRATFLNDPNIGGRYSALSYFGIVPAALVGVDIDKLLRRSLIVAANASASGDNKSRDLGAIMGELAKAGRDKVTLVLSPEIASFGDWVEQLIAESTGKNGKGILPVVGETLGSPDVYGDDRLFVYLKLENDSTHDAPVQALQAAKQPVVRIELRDAYDLGGQFFMWEMATVIAGERIGIQPFDQPNVEAAKVLARQMIAEYEEKGKLPELEPSLQAGDVTVYGDVSGHTPQTALQTFLADAKPGDYIAIHAYIQPTDRTTEALSKLQDHLRDQYKLATTVGYGPRFLHSTGQLHKGDAGNGLFIQITAPGERDADIPDEAGQSESAMSFGTLKLAQALGDRQALLDANRRVLRIDTAGEATSLISSLL